MSNPDYNKIAKEVINGKWGNGDVRKKKLKAAGYDYDKVQSAVNKLLKGTVADNNTLEVTVDLSKYNSVTLNIVGV